MNRARKFDLSHYSEPLAELIWILKAAKGEFRLLLVRCNYIRWRSHIFKQVQTTTDLDIQVVKLKPGDITLHERIRVQVHPHQPDAVMIFNLESVQNLMTMLSAANQVREEFRKQFPYPVVLWVTDSVLQQLMRVASDLESWGTTLEFALPPTELISLLQRDTDALFATALLTDQYTIGWQLGYLRRQEINTAVSQLRQIDVPISPELQASIDFAIAQTAYLNQQIDVALANFTRSWEFWHHQTRLNQTSSLIDNPHLRTGVLDFYMSLCHYQLAEQNQDPTSELIIARSHIQSCLDIFHRYNLTNLVAKYINLLGSILLRQEAWLELEQLAIRATDLQRLYGNPLRLAQAYGFLGVVALQSQRFLDAKEYLHKAIHSLAKLKTASPLSARYLLQLAQAEYGLENIQIAVRYLEIARYWGISDNWREYLKILQRLRSHYRISGQYLDAFRLKQEMYSIMVQHGVHAFVGINSIQPPKPAKLAIMQWLGISPRIEHTPEIAPEIIASGRIFDVECLIERIIRPDYKLIILHGDSGVGKTSLIQAGLIPGLMRRATAFQKIIAVIIRHHPNWRNLLIDHLYAAISQTQIVTKHHQQQNSTDDIFNIFQFYIQNNFRLVLIFDQFEDFLSPNTDLSLKQELSNFISECLNILAIKVIFSLCSKFIPVLKQYPQIKSIYTIQNDLINQDNYYHLPPLTPAAAFQLITRLNQHRYLGFETSLIQQIIDNLTIEQQISPLQLQITAIQLQTEGITTLAQYQKYGSQTHLITRYLYGIIAECGSSNREMTIQILRHLQTSPQTMNELEMKLPLSQSTNVELILEILTLAGIVLIKPNRNVQQYQIAYTYLYEIIQEKLS